MPSVIYGTVLSYLNIMKKLFFLLLFFAVATMSGAQSLRYGYFSLDSIFTAMPEYAVAQKNLSDLRAKYDEEMKRAENEFNAKYEEFLETQRDMIPSILYKRQTELQEIMDKNIAFKKEAMRLLEEARKDAYAPLRASLPLYSIPTTTPALMSIRPAARTSVRC